MLKRGSILTLVMLVFLGVFISGSILFYQVSKVTEIRESIGSKPFKIDLALFYERITGNTDCLAAEEYTVVPTSIDMDKFNSDSLDNCIRNDPALPQLYPSVQLEILDGDKVESTVKTSNFVRYKLDSFTVLTNIYEDGAYTAKYVRVTGSPGIE